MALNLSKFGVREYKSLGPIILVNFKVRKITMKMRAFWLLHWKSSGIP